MRHGLLQHEDALRRHARRPKRPTQGLCPRGVARGIQEHAHGLRLPWALRAAANAKGPRQDARGGVEGGAEGPEADHGAECDEDGGHAGDGDGGGLWSIDGVVVGKEGDQGRGRHVGRLLLLLVGRCEALEGVRPEVAADVGARC